MWYSIAVTLIAVLVYFFLRKSYKTKENKLIKRLHEENLDKSSEVYQKGYQDGVKSQAYLQERVLKLENELYSKKR